MENQIEADLLLGQFASAESECKVLKDPHSPFYKSFMMMIKWKSSNKMKYFFPNRILL
jgi:hypothetical protein